MRPENYIFRGSQVPDSPRLAPNRAKHGTAIGRVTKAHHEEVRMRTDGHPSAPPPGPQHLRRKRVPHVLFL
jgi:hypothetical protein